jgi:hypothetical protein
VVTWNINCIKRLLSLSNRGFGLTPSQVRRAAYISEEKKGITVPWKSAEELTVKDWFSNFMQINTQLSLRKPEDLSKG